MEERFGIYGRCEKMFGTKPRVYCGYKVRGRGSSVLKLGVVWPVGLRTEALSRNKAIAYEMKLVLKAQSSCTIYTSVALSPESSKRAKQNIEGRINGANKRARANKQIGCQTSSIWANVEHGADVTVSLPPLYTSRNTKLAVHFGHY